MNEIMFFLSGIAFISFALAGVFFLKFWRASGDKFFKGLTASCWLLALERLIALINFVIDPSEDGQTYSRSWLYMLRLVAFICIIVPVVQKNSSSARKS